MKSLALLGLASLANAHTVFTTLFINEKNQGDGTCVRMPLDPQTATAPIDPIDGPDMACGRDGGTAVQYTCPADKGSLLTFEFRLWPDYEQPGSIDPGHRGPCAVYAKKMDSMSDSAAGPGWFKIWEDGYNPDTKKWCVDTLIANNGLLSVQLPEGLPSGNYLVRPEILALHNAWRGDPQFYVGCAQVFIQSDVTAPLDVPADKSVSIPGYVSATTPGLTYNIYDAVLPPYPIPGPEVFIPAASGSGTAGAGAGVGAQSAKQLVAKQQQGAVPSDCLIKNANWCGEPIARHTTEDACYAGLRQCYAQSKQCYASATPAGSANCKTWDEYCQQVGNACDAGNFNGPPPFQGSEKFAAVPGPIPQPWNNVFQPEAEPESAGSAQKNAGNNGNAPQAQAQAQAQAPSPSPSASPSPSQSPSPSVNPPPSRVTVTSFITVTLRTTATVTARS